MLLATFVSGSGSHYIKSESIIWDELHYNLCLFNMSNASAAHQMCQQTVYTETQKASGSLIYLLKAKHSE